MTTNETALTKFESRLTILRDRVRGVGLGHHTGCYLYGRPGTGKTFTLRSTLEEKGVTYAYSNGHLTPLGLFDLIGEYNDQVIVLDDIASIFNNDQSMNILLAALGKQPSEERIIQYKRSGKQERVFFSGGVVCISNMKLHSKPLQQALLSRIPSMDFDPTEEETNRTLASHFLPSPSGELRS